MKKLFLKPEFAIFLVCLLVFLVHLEKGGGEESFRYLDLTHAIVDEKRFEIDTYKDNTGDVSIFNKHYYAGAAPGLSFLGVLPYLPFSIAYNKLSFIKNSNLHEVLNQALKENYIFKGYSPDSEFLKIDLVQFFVGNILIIIFTSFLLSAILAVLIYKTLNLIYIDKRLNFIITLFGIFGTILFSYTIIYHSHVPSAFFIFFSYYIIFKAKIEKKERTIDYFMVGFLAAFALLINYSLVIIEIPLLLYLVYVIKAKRIKKLSYTLLGASIPIVFLALYFYSIFNNPFITPHDYPAPAISGTHETGFYGFTYPHLDRALVLLFSSYRGYFFYMPILILSLLGAWNIFKYGNRRIKFEDITFISALFIVTLLYYSSYSKWYGPWSFGPRHLIPTIPFLILLIPAAITSNFRKNLFYILSIISIFINWLGANFGRPESKLTNPLFQKYIPLVFSSQLNLRLLKYIGKLFNIKPFFLVLATILLLMTLIFGILLYIKIVFRNIKIVKSRNI